MDTAKPDQDIIAQAKRRKLEALLKRKASGPRTLPLSVGQERLYRLAQLDPGKPFYNVAVSYRLRGRLDADAVKRAVLRVGERHHVLRASFPIADGRPVQRISSRLHEDGVFRVQKIGSAALEAREQLLAQAIADEAAQLFDIATGPLWRVGLFRCSPDDHALTLTMHHIVTDGWSFELILAELSRLIDAFARGEDDLLAPPSLQYETYAERQRALFQDVAFEHQRAYWLDHFAGAVPAPKLPEDRRPNDLDDRHASSSPFTPPLALAEKLNALAKREGVSLFMVTLTAFAGMLHRWSGQTDLLVCTPVTGRHRAQSREVVGYCNNILPIRLDLSGDPSLGEMLARVRQTTLDAYKHQDVPFQEICEAPALRRIPLSRLLFSLDMAWPPRFQIPGLVCAPISVETGAADFDFSVSLWTEAAGLRGTLRYKDEWFSPERVAVLGEAYQGVLAALADTPELPLSSLPAPGFGPARDDIVEAADNGRSDLPRSPLEERVAREWRAVFDEAEIRIHDDFRALGASSLAVATLAERLNAAFGVELAPPVLFRAGTIARVARLLENADKSLLSDPVAPIRSEGTRTPLFLCEGVGIYYQLAERLPESQPVYGLVRMDESWFKTVEDIAAHYVEAIRRIQPSGPYAIGGLSFGGLVAFEVAQQLKGVGETVKVLALFDTPGPNAYSPKGGLGWAMGHLGNLRRFGRAYLAAKLQRKIRSALRKKAASSEPPLDADRVRDGFRHFASHYAVRPYEGDILLFKLAQRDGMTDSLFDPALGHIDPLLGWGSVASGLVDSVEVEGDHVGLLREPHVAAVAARLETLLA
jgi:thioesterase domain-containing protein